MSQGRTKTGGRTQGEPVAGRFERNRNISGARIRAARRASEPRLTLVDLAARVRDLGIPVDVNALSKIERGEREVNDFELKAIAEALNKPIKWLVDEKDTI